VPPDRDISYLVHVLESTHPNLYAHESRSTFLHLALAAEAELHDHPGDDPYEIIAPLLASLGDAHTYTSPYNAPYVWMRDAGGRLFPFEIYRQRDAFMIGRMYGKQRSIPDGTQIVALDGQRMRQLWDALGRNISAERGALRDNFISEDLRPLLWHAGYRAPFRVTLRDPNGKTFVLLLPGCTKDDIAAWDSTPHGEIINAPITYTYDVIHRVAIVRVHSFSTDDDQDQPFMREIALIRNRLRRDQPMDLLIDVRYNDGGSSTLADALADVFALHPYRDYSRVIVKSSVFIKHRLGHDDYVALYGNAAWDAPDGKVLRHEVSDRMLPARDGAHVRGNTYILIGSGTFSMATTFAAAAQDAHNAVILGRESGGDATYFGEAFLFTLPSSGYDVSVATKYVMRANGDTSRRGVIPDVTLDESPEGFPDPELRAALRAIVDRRERRV
jgi:hypothetical protein